MLISNASKKKETAEAFTFKTKKSQSDLKNDIYLFSMNDIDTRLLSSSELRFQILESCPETPWCPLADPFSTLELCILIKIVVVHVPLKRFKLKSYQEEFTPAHIMPEWHRVPEQVSIQDTSIILYSDGDDGITAVESEPSYSLYAANTIQNSPARKVLHCPYASDHSVHHFSSIVGYDKSQFWQLFCKMGFMLHHSPYPSIPALPHLQGWGHHLYSESVLLSDTRVCDSPHICLRLNISSSFVIVAKETSDTRINLIEVYLKKKYCKFQVDIFALGVEANKEERTTFPWRKNPSRRPHLSFCIAQIPEELKSPGVSTDVLCPQGGVTVRTLPWEGCSTLENACRDTLGRDCSLKNHAEMSIKTWQPAVMEKMHNMIKLGNQHEKVCGTAEAIAFFFLPPLVSSCVSVWVGLYLDEGGYELSPKCKDVELNLYTYQEEFVPPQANERPSALVKEATKYGAAKKVPDLPTLFDRLLFDSITWEMLEQLREFYKLQINSRRNGRNEKGWLGTGQRCGQIASDRRSSPSAQAQIHMTDIMPENDVLQVYLYLPDAREHTGICGPGELGANKWCCAIGKSSSNAAPKAGNTGTLTTVEKLKWDSKGRKRYLRTETYSENIQIKALMEAQGSGFNPSFRSPKITHMSQRLMLTALKSARLNGVPFGTGRRKGGCRRGEKKKNKLKIEKELWENFLSSRLLLDPLDLKPQLRKSLQSSQLFLGRSKPYSKAEQSIPSSFLMFREPQAVPHPGSAPVTRLFPGRAPRTSSGSLSGSSCLGAGTGGFLTTEWYKKLFKRKAIALFLTLVRMLLTESCSQLSYRLPAIMVSVTPEPDKIKQIACVRGWKFNLKESIYPDILPFPFFTVSSFATNKKERRTTGIGRLLLMLFLRHGNSTPYLKDKHYIAFTALLPPAVLLTHRVLLSTFIARTFPRDVNPEMIRQMLKEYSLMQKDDFYIDIIPILVQEVLQEVRHTFKCYVTTDNYVPVTEKSELILKRRASIKRLIQQKKEHEGHPA
ncbi:hypothetical protein DV515_00006085 [Chloebia gouldiae]|uniref:Uncharacterized protein n=1 Tax=Chloebia gouldiae TaxID=44316 RepID=A0A3L8SN30_CHLGU|nr:hypothetical protein DV515_00006085 [Chloebia gouldiae]